MDLDEAKVTYLNECQELLQDMEYALLNLESSPDDENLINAIFRAAHTIKG
ncbi:MAG: two-component system chemotaxis family sensor kinase CheA, partial [Halothiobacillaceae bacterium]